MKAKRRGNETSCHFDMKERVSRILKSEGFVVLTEHKGADVVAYELEEGKAICLEMERSFKNLKRNWKRNSANGCEAHIVVAPDEKTLKRYRSKIEERGVGGDLARIEFLNAQTIDRGSLLNAINGAKYGK